MGAGQTFEHIAVDHQSYGAALPTQTYLETESVNPPKECLSSQLPCCLWCPGKGILRPAFFTMHLERRLSNDPVFPAGPGEAPCFRAEQGSSHSIRSDAGRM